MDDTATRRLCSWPAALLPSLLLAGLLTAAGSAPDRAGDSTDEPVVQLTVTPSR